MKDLLDHREQNKQIQSSLKKGIEDLFPIKSGGKTLTIKNLTLDDTLSETDFPAQRETKLNRGT